MLDFAFSELVVIGVVALVVIGPERLPRVARTAGHLLGRFQRYVREVQTDINREMELADLKKLHGSVADMGRSIEESVRTGMADAERGFQQAQGEVEKLGQQAQAAMTVPMPHMGTGPAAATGDADTQLPAAHGLPGSLSAEAGEPVQGELALPDTSPQLSLDLDRDAAVHEAPAVATPAPAAPAAPTPSDAQRA